MKKLIKIYIATHKEFDVPYKSNYLPLHVGAEGKEDLNYLKDDVGINISKKNKNFCELTGLYWIWKNSHANIVGLVHYRRYFTDKICKNNTNILSVGRIDDFLNNYDIIVPRLKILNTSVKTHYAIHHYLSDLQDVRKICHNLYPDYDSAFRSVLKQKSLYCYNMFICNKKTFDSYCGWLFSILFELEKIKNVDVYSDYQKRMYGFLSERLFNVWLYKQNLRVKELPVFNTESTTNFNLEAQEDTDFISQKEIFKYHIKRIIHIDKK